MSDDAHLGAPFMHAAAAVQHAQRFDPDDRFFADFDAATAGSDFGVLLAAGSGVAGLAAGCDAGVPSDVGFAGAFESVDSAAGAADFSPCLYDSLR
jgi:hypothetical protein